MHSEWTAICLASAILDESAWSSARVWVFFRMPDSFEDRASSGAATRRSEGSTPPAQQLQGWNIWTWTDLVARARRDLVHIG